MPLGAHKWNLVSLLLSSAAVMLSGAALVVSAVRPGGMREPDALDSSAGRNPDGKSATPGTPERVPGPQASGLPNLTAIEKELLSTLSGAQARIKELEARMDALTVGGPAAARVWGNPLGRPVGPGEGPLLGDVATISYQFQRYKQALGKEDATLASVARFHLELMANPESVPHWVKAWAEHTNPGFDGTSELLIATVGRIAPRELLREILATCSPSRDPKLLMNAVGLVTRLMRRFPTEVREKCFVELREAANAFGSSPDENVRSMVTDIQEFLAR